MCVCVCESHTNLPMYRTPPEMVECSASEQCSIWQIGSNALLRPHALPEMVECSASERCSLKRIGSNALLRPRVPPVGSARMLCFGTPLPWGGRQPKQNIQLECSACWRLSATRLCFGTRGTRMTQQTTPSWPVSINYRYVRDDPASD